MPLEHVQPDDLLPMAERRQAGHDLRRVVPRRQHANWTACFPTVAIRWIS